VTFELAGWAVRRWLAGLVLAVSLAGCQAEEATGPAGPVAAPSASPAGRVPPVCTAGGTRAAVEGFFAALSAGRVRELDPFFAPAGRFQWYANGVRPARRLDSAASDRGSLLAYLLRRQARHERITLVALDFNGYRAADRTGHFAMRLRRTADDLPGGPQRLGGKGAVDCDSGGLMVLGIGQWP
jgi:ribosome modulation factor